MLMLVKLTRERTDIKVQKEVTARDPDEVER